MSKPISELPSFVHALFADVVLVLHETATRVRDRMAVTGDPITYPVQWDSDKQRRYVMAKLRKENNLPYQRRNVYPTLYEIAYHDFGANVHADHPAGAISGLASGWQSRIHRGRYPHLLTVLFEELGKIPNEISNRFSVRSGHD